MPRGEIVIRDEQLAINPGQLPLAFGELNVDLPTTDKRTGRVFTPDAVAQALCRWAIRAPNDLVLDLGVGEGAFVWAAFERLRALGASDAEAGASIYGAELDAGVFARAQAVATSRLGSPLPNVVCADFHQTTLPAADAVVGNPPYIRRHYLDESDRLLATSGNGESSGLTDAYCYFLLRACKALRPGGRLAVVVSASWLDMRYGRELKQMLLDQFRLHLLLGFDGQVFPNALVKPVVVLAEKAAGDAPVSFARLGHTVPLESLRYLLEDLAAGRTSPDVALTRVDTAKLAPDLPWSAFLRTPELYAELTQQVALRSMRDVAESRIGLQTFAKRFYVLTRPEAQRWGIEDEYLLPLALSPRAVGVPILATPEQTQHVVFACDQPETLLRGTRAGSYVAWGMHTPVQVRGKDEVVQGFHQAPRLVRARRQPWYNLRTEIRRRGAYPILLPRRVFESYLVVHNRVGAVGNEDFIELRPHAGEAAVATMLAFLNSSFGEFLVRSHSFQYGGGVFNLNPGAVRNIPVLDHGNVSDEDRVKLACAWEEFVSVPDRINARRMLDHVVAEVLGVSPDLRQRVEDARALFIDLARSASQTYRQAEPQHVAS